MKRTVAAALLLSFFFVANSAFADLIFFVQEVGANIQITASGSLDTTGWTFGNNPPGTAFIRSERVTTGLSAPSGVGFIESPTISSFTVSGGASTTTNVFAATLGYIPAASSSGDYTGMRFSGSSIIVALPVGYSSGSPISGTATFNNLSLTSLGMTSTTTWKWDLGAPGSITITAVPEAGSLAVVGGLVGTLVPGLTVLNRRRRQA